MSNQNNYKKKKCSDAENAQEKEKHKIVYLKIWRAAAAAMQFLREEARRDLKLNL